MAEPPSQPDYLPAIPLSVLEERSRCLRQLRQFFDAAGFWEVDTPLLSADTVVDRYLDPIPVTLFDDPCRPQDGRRLWLQTSPEFAMKRILATGAQKIYQITRAFRAGESGQLHNPEFTIVEWYRVNDSYEEGQEFLAELAVEMLPDVTQVDRLSYQDAFLQHVGLDPLEATRQEIARSIRQAGVDSVDENDRDGCLNLLLALKVEPQLGKERPVILFDYPASQAALARISEEDPRIARRFELYFRGVELANGYQELLDAKVLEGRIESTNRQRERDGKYTLPSDSHLLAAMRAGIPPSAGVALGFDRLLMLRLNLSSIHNSLPFPLPRA